jgi:GNAT superfamily N-acetyltransferase
VLLDNLPPDISFVPIERTSDGQEVAYQIKKESLGPHVIVKWGWDDVEQRALHNAQFALRDVLGIFVQEQLVGTIAIKVTGESLHLDDFYILAHRQNNGLGSKVLKHVQAMAFNIGVPLTLQVLKWNPAVAFYSRHGLRETAQTETHILMSWEPAALIKIG